MKIIDQNSATIQNSHSGIDQELSRAKTSSTPLSGPSTEDDRIDLSAKSSLQALAKSLGDESQNARLEQLRALVNSGSYQINPAALSQAIVAGIQRGD